MNLKWSIQSDTNVFETKFHCRKLVEKVQRIIDAQVNSVMLVSLNKCLKHLTLIDRNEVVTLNILFERFVYSVGVDYWLYQFH